MRGVVATEATGDRIAVHDRRRALLTAAVGFALLPARRDQPEVGMLRRWLDTWAGLGLVAVGMARQRYDLQLTRYAEQGWRATSILPASRIRWSAGAGGYQRRGVRCSGRPGQPCARWGRRRDLV